MSQNESGTGAEDTRGASVLDSDQLQPEDTLDDRGVADPLDEGYSPPERPFAAEGFGTTAEEVREGESLDDRLAEEVPDPNLTLPDPVDDPRDAQDAADRELSSIDEDSQEDGDYLDDGEVGDDRAGRLVAPDEGAHEVTEPEMLGGQVGIDGGASSAEEAAMHVVDGD